jgi:hypothetical protein
VTGIVATLGAKNPVRLPRHHIENLSFPFVSPLETQDDRDLGFQQCLSPEKSLNRA